MGTVHELDEQWISRLVAQMPLEAGSVLFRVTEKRDAQTWLEMCNNRQLREFVGPVLNKTLEECESIVTDRPLGAASLFAVEIDGSVVGIAGFLTNSYEREIVDMSVMLTDGNRGRGYGRRIVQGLYSLWTDDLGYPMCWATTWQRNAGGNSILRSCGFSILRSYDDIRFGENVLVYGKARSG